MLSHSKIDEELIICNKATWPTKPQVFTNWFFIEKVCQLDLYVSLCNKATHPKL